MHPIVVSFALIVENVDYTQLVERPAVLHGFKAATKHGVASAMPVGTDPSNVGLTLSGGSVVAECTVAIAPGADGKVVRRAVQQPHRIAQAVERNLQKMEQLSTVSTGRVLVAHITAPVVTNLLQMESAPPGLDVRVWIAAAGVVIAVLTAVLLGGDVASCGCCSHRGGPRRVMPLGADAGGAARDAGQHVATSRLLQGHLQHGGDVQPTAMPVAEQQATRTGDSPQDLDSVLNNLEAAEQAIWGEAFTQLSRGAPAVAHSDEGMRHFLTTHTSLGPAELDAVLFSIAPEGSLTAAEFVKVIRQNAVQEPDVLEYFKGLETYNGTTISPQSGDAGLRQFMGTQGVNASGASEEIMRRIMDSAFSHMNKEVILEEVNMDEWLMCCQRALRTFRVLLYAKIPLHAV